MEKLKRKFFNKWSNFEMLPLIMKVLICIIMGWFVFVAIRLMSGQWSQYYGFSTLGKINDIVVSNFLIGALLGALVYVTLNRYWKKIAPSGHIPASKIFGESLKQNKTIIAISLSSLVILTLAMLASPIMGSNDYRNVKHFIIHTNKVVSKTTQCSKLDELILLNRFFEYDDMIDAFENQHSSEGNYHIFITKKEENKLVKRYDDLIRNINKKYLALGCESNAVRAAKFYINAFNAKVKELTMGAYNCSVSDVDGFIDDVVVDRYYSAVKHACEGDLMTIKKIEQQRDEFFNSKKEYLKQQKINADSQYFLEETYTSDYFDVSSYKGYGIIGEYAMKFLYRQYDPIIMGIQLFFTNENFCRFRLIYKNDFGGVVSNTINYGLVGGIVSGLLYDDCVNESNKASREYLDRIEFKYNITDVGVISVEDLGVFYYDCSLTQLQYGSTNIILRQE